MRPLSNCWSAFCLFTQPWIALSMIAIASSRNLEGKSQHCSALSTIPRISSMARSITINARMRHSKIQLWPNVSRASTRRFPSKSSPGFGVMPSFWMKCGSYGTNFWYCIIAKGTMSWLRIREQSTLIRIPTSGTMLREPDRIIALPRQKLRKQQSARRRPRSRVCARYSPKPMPKPSPEQRAKHRALQQPSTRQ